MASRLGRISLRAFTAAAAVASLHMARAEAHAPQNAAVPHDAKSIDQSAWTPEQRGVFAAVNRDMAQAGLGQPAYYAPFPEKLGADGFYSHDADALVGAAEQGPLRQWSVQATHLTNWGCSSNRTGDPALYERERTEIFLHETAHRIGDKLQLIKPVEKIIAGSALDKKTKTILLTNANERFAEMAATLYIMGNLKNPQPLVAGNYRLEAVHAPGDPAHDTISSISDAVIAYRDHPRPGLSIVEAARWSAQILQSRVSRLGHDYVVNREVREELVSPDMLWGHPTRLGANLMGIPQSRFGDVSRKFDQIKQAEQNLCAGDQASPLLPASAGKTVFPALRR